MSDLNRIKERIRKLLNLAADDGAAEGEIENALRTAREMMLAHQLDEDEVTLPPEDLRTPEEIAAATEYGTARSWADMSRPPQWMATLAVAVAEFVGTVHVYNNHPERQVLPSGIVKHDGRRVKSWEFYGPADDVAFAVELHQELILAAASTAKLKWGGGLARGEASEYCFGFASGLYDKVMAAKKVEEVAPALPGRTQDVLSQQTCALTIVRATDIMQAKREQAIEWLHKKAGWRPSGKYRSGGSRSIHNDRAYSQGRADGASQSLTRSRVARIG